MKACPLFGDLEFDAKSQPPRSLEYSELPKERCAAAPPHCKRESRHIFDGLMLLLTTARFRLSRRANSLTDRTELKRPLVGQNRLRSNWTRGGGQLSGFLAYCPQVLGPFTLRNPTRGYETVGEAYNRSDSARHPRK